MMASDGSLYGTLTFGGYPSLSSYCATASGARAQGCGTVVQVSPNGAFTVLHQFRPQDFTGAFPTAPLVQAHNGTIYGVVPGGMLQSAPDPAMWGLPVFANNTTSLVDLSSPCNSPSGAYSAAGMTLGTDGDMYVSLLPASATNPCPAQFIHWEIATGGGTYQRIPLAGFAGSGPPLAEGLIATSTDPPLGAARTAAYSESPQLGR